jgi:hypothetical protein
MKKKSQSADMQATVQRKFAIPDCDISPTTAIPRSTEFDLHPAVSRTHCGFDECSFVQDKPGNAMWTEKDRP